jgi:hypothetical protein
VTDTQNLVTLRQHDLQVSQYCRAPTSMIFRCPGHQQPYQGGHHPGTLAISHHLLLVLLEQAAARMVLKTIGWLAYV